MTSATFERIRGIHPPTAVRGEGVYVIDREGRRYLDACGGAAIACLGYSERRVTDAIARQATELSFVHQLFFTSDAAEQLAVDLVSDAPAGLTRVFYGSGGSEQIDGTIKLCRQFWLDSGEPERTRVVCRRPSFHGNSIGALTVGRHQQRRAPYLPLLRESHEVSAPYAYRHRGPGETDTAYADRLGREFEDCLLALGPETVMAFIAETVGGAVAGCLTPPAGYLAKIRAICDRHGVLLVLDEIMCGLGRTGHRFACEEDGVVPDAIVLAKGLAAGYQPISATIVSERIYRTIMDRRGYFQHGHSYQAHPIACAAALATQRVIREDRLIENVRRQGALLESLLAERFGNHPHVGDIRGRGLFRALELVADRTTKEPFDPTSALWLKVLKTGMDRGLMCYPGGGTADGFRGDHVLLAPAFNVTEPDVERMVDLLAETIDAAIAARDLPLDRIP